jgi:hypothetical protein
MRVFIVLAAIAGALALTAAASAATVNDSVLGVEIGFTPTQATFVGKATGDLPGFWKAVVNHTPLSPNATITGGRFKLLTDSQRIVGRFAAGGTITQTDPGLNCTNQKYVVVDALTNVGVGGLGSGSGTFQVLLTHFRAQVPGFGCVTYAATVAGTLSLTLP